MNDLATPNQSTEFDPVCGMAIETFTAKHSSEYRGTTYVFCSKMCLNAFEDDPQQYLAHRSPTPNA
jgi:YHS domain-containing protein